MSRVLFHSSDGRPGSSWTAGILAVTDLLRDILDSQLASYLTLGGLRD